MTADPFTERLAKVRQRFVAALERKIEDCYAELPLLSGEGAVATATLEETYRRVHGIVGVGPTVGFPATGHAARNVEQVLVPARRARRGLDADEMQALRTVLSALRDTARHELQLAAADAR